MLAKLKSRFMILSALTLFALLSVLLICMNLLNYNSVIHEADTVLDLLSVNRGTFPGVDESGTETKEEPNPQMKENEGAMGEFPQNGAEGFPFRLPHDMSIELPYESRYFSVLLSENGEVLHIDTRRIAAIDGETAKDYALQVLEKSNERGFINQYRYAVRVENKTTQSVRITFLDCGRRMDSYKSFLRISVTIALIAFLAVLLIAWFFAERIIRPIAESYAKQKRFITDAGHEIKTPLTIVNANVDILEMELGENESLTDIRQQTRRLTELTNDLVQLARMEEHDSSTPMVEIPLSEIVRDSAEAFSVLASSQGRELRLDVHPLLSIVGNDRSMEKLVSILLDNAIKYSKCNSVIHLTLAPSGKNAVALTVENETESVFSAKDLDKIFQRFYRADPSRNSSTGGYGIGLSLAQAIVSAHKGKISATAPDSGRKFTVSAVFPQSNL